MRKSGKATFWVVAVLIFTIAYLSFFGVQTHYGDISTTQIKGAADIRWGIDIRGGVDATFSPAGDISATREEMEAAESIIKVRLVNQNITDYEVYTDYTRGRIIVRFPWKAGEENFDPEEAIKELGETAVLTFREGMELDDAGLPTGVTASNVILEGKDVYRAYLAGDENGNAVVALELNESGKTAFAEATARLAGTGEVISIWMDETMISAPSVSSAIPDGKATITSPSFIDDPQEAKDLANKINGGALPFKLETSNFSTISPTLGQGSRDAMILAGIIAFCCIALFMITIYRLPGFVASIALLGQAALMIAAVTGFHWSVPSFTLTLPGIAGIILSLGMGVDANVITAERIAEEIRAGKTIDGAVESGFKRAFTAIFDGNVTVIIVAIILMGTFGPSESIFSKLLRIFFFMFGPTTTGTIYSFGFTLLVGVILNMVMGVFASRIMLKSISKYKAFRNPWFFGGAKND